MGLENAQWLGETDDGYRGRWRISIDDLIEEVERANHNGPILRMHVNGPRMVPEDMLEWLEGLNNYMDTYLIVQTDPIRDPITLDALTVEKFY